MSRHLLIAFVAAIAVLAVRLAADAKQMEENKKIIAAFYDAALDKKDFAEASKYLGSKTSSTIRSPPTGRRGSRRSSPS